MATRLVVSLEKRRLAASSKTGMVARSMCATFRQRAAIEAVCLRAGLSVGQILRKETQVGPITPQRGQTLIS